LDQLLVLPTGSGDGGVHFTAILFCCGVDPNRKRRSEQVQTTVLTASVGRQRHPVRRRLKRNARQENKFLSQ
jgi:hypothetical protein